MKAQVIWNDAKENNFQLNQNEHWNLILTLSSKHRLLAGLNFASKVECV